MKANLFQYRCIKIMLVCLCISCVAFTTALNNGKENTIIHPKMDIASPQKVIIQFLQWYKINYKKAGSFPFLKKDSVGNFMINQIACKSYLNFMKSSKCLSSKYLAYWQAFFNNKSLELKKNPVQSDITEGFDVDFVLITQEPDIILNKIASLKCKMVSLNENVALVRVTLPTDKSVQYEFEMYKYKEGWQIEFISPSNYD